MLKRVASVVVVIAHRKERYNKYPSRPLQG